MPAAGHLAAGEEIDGLVSDLRAAGNGGYQWVTGPFFLDLTLRKPRRLSPLRGYEIMSSTVIEPVRSVSELSRSVIS